MTEERERKIDGKFSMKYSVSGGRIVNTVSGEEIPEDEPLFLLRARDHNAIVAINAYQAACEDDGCNELHLAGAQQVRENFCRFAAEHPERMKQPGITRHLKLDAPAPSLEKATPEERQNCKHCGLRIYFDSTAPIPRWFHHGSNLHLCPETNAEPEAATVGGEDWIREAARVYVASSWRNEFQPKVIQVLREDGYEVYDFRNPPHGKGGFGWSQIGKEWQQWTPQEYLAALQHPLAEEGFKSDMDALRWCNVCVFVMPCGPSASMEMGWASGSGRKVIAYIPAMREPDLMVKMADYITDDLNEVRAIIRKHHAGGRNELVRDAAKSGGGVSAAIS